MPVTRAQSRATSSPLPLDPTDASTDESSSSSGGVSLDWRGGSDHLDERTRLSRKLTKILDLFQPNKFKPKDLQRAKEGVFPEHLSRTGIIRTRLYMSWANTVVQVALQDLAILRTMTDSVSDAMVVLSEIEDTIDQELDNFSRRPHRTTAEVQARDKRLEERLSDAMSSANEVAEEATKSKDPTIKAVAIMIKVLRDLGDRTNLNRQSTQDMLTDLMHQALGYIEISAEDVTRDYVDDLEEIVELLEGRRDASLDDLVSHAKDTLYKAQAGRDAR